MSMILKILFLMILLNTFSYVSAQDTSKVSQLSFFEKGNINGYVFYQFGRVLDFEKNKTGNIDFASPVYRYKNSVGLNLGVHLFENVFFRTTLYYQLNKNINSPWLNTDYSYSLERTKWDYNSFSYGYVNYQINKYEDIGKNFMNSFSRGSFYFRYFNHLPAGLLSKLNIKKPFNFNYYFTAYYAVCYLDNEGKMNGNLTHGKPVFSLNGRYIFFKDFFIEGSVNYFPISKTKVNSDADFTYGFGYNKYTKFSIGLTYGNYSVNRFPWNKKTVDGYGFLDGNFTVLVNYKW